MKIIGNVYEESDYSVFKKLDNNRSVTKKRCEKLIASISTRFVICPIVVNKNMEIIDGQGRYEALKSLKKPIIYVIDDNASIEECRLMNRYNTSWTGNDFVDSYAHAGYPSYVNLKAAMNETKKTFAKVLNMTNHTSQQGKESYIESGKLIFPESDIDKAVKRFEMADEIIDALQFEKRVNDAFYSACRIMFGHKDYNHDWMLMNCKKNKHLYDQMANLESEVKELSSIYNKGLKANKKIYFEDYFRNRGYNAQNYNRKNDLTDISTL